MAHSVSLLGFLAVMAGSVGVIWMMLTSHSAAILSALGVEVALATPRPMSRSVRVKPARSNPARSLALLAQRAA